MTASSIRSPARPLTHLRLVPVIEFEPGRYAHEEIPSPGVSGADDPEGWRRYWEQCLASAGLHLEPLYPGSWLVPISRLTEAHVLREMLRGQLSHVDPEDPDLPPSEQVSSLSGGHALFEGEDLILTPRCCAELKDLECWDDAARVRVSKLGTFYIGHPQLFASWEEPWLVLREEMPDRNGVLREYPLSPRALSLAVDEARKEQEDLARRLQPLLAERFASEMTLPLGRQLAGCNTTQG